LAAAALIALPVLSVFWTLTQDSGGTWSHLNESGLLARYAGNTLALGLGVGCLAGLLGTSTAWLITSCDFPGRRLLHGALCLPLAVPTYLSAYAWTDLLQGSGPVQAALRSWTGWERSDYWFPDIRSLPGAILILSFGLYPYVYLAARAAFREQTGSALEVSRTLGHGPWSSFLQISLPLARPAIAAGTLLVLMETCAEFGAVSYFAVDTMSTGVYRTLFGLDSLTAAGQLASSLMVAVALILGLETFARRQARFHSATLTYRQKTAYRLRPLAGMAATVGCCLPVLLGFFVPVAMFVWLTWRGGDRRAGELFWGYAGNSFYLATIASLAAVALATLIAASSRGPQGWLMRATAHLARLGYAVPGTVLGIGLLLPLTWFDHTLNRWIGSIWGLEARPGLILTGTVIAVLLGYQARFLAVSLGVIETSLARIRVTFGEAARTLGAGPLRVLWSVQLPLMWTSLLAAGLLVFVDVVKELPATLILRPFDFETLAVRVYQLAHDERLEEASTGALAIIAVGLWLVLWVSYLLEPRRHASK
jgi:iron(III) transport system permease protein